MDANKQLIKLKLQLCNLLSEIADTGDISETNSEILFQLENDPDLEGLISDDSY